MRYPPVVIPFIAGSERTESLYYERVARLRQAMLERGIRYCVAPGVSLRTVHGVLAPALAEVSAEDLGGPGHLRALIVVGKVIEADLPDSEPPSAA